MYSCMSEELRACKSEILEPLTLKFTIDSTFVSLRIESHSLAVSNTTNTPTQLSVKYVRLRSWLLLHVSGAVFQDPTLAYDCYKSCSAIESLNKYGSISGISCSFAGIERRRRARTCSCFKAAGRFSMLPLSIASYASAALFASGQRVRSFTKKAPSGRRN